MLEINIKQEGYNNSFSSFLSLFWKVVCSWLNIFCTVYCNEIEHSNAGCNEIELNIVAKLKNVSQDKLIKKKVK